MLRPDEQQLPVTSSVYTSAIYRCYTRFNMSSNSCSAHHAQEPIVIVADEDIFEATFSHVELHDVVRKVRLQSFCGPPSSSRCSIGMVVGLRSCN